MVKRPRDPAQLAKQVFDIAIGEELDSVGVVLCPTCGVYYMFDAHC